MEREANYAAVGAFVLVILLVGALFVYWYSDSRDHKTVRRYEIYFDGSVSGLERGAGHHDDSDQAQQRPREHRSAAAQRVTG